MKKDLRWEAIILYENDDQERDWVQVDGKTTDIAGIGDTNVAVTVVNATKSNSILTARVEFIYYNSNGNELARKYINVCRCSSCGCDDLEFDYRPCDCENVTIILCDCDKLELEKTSLEWDWDKTNVQEISFTADTCIIGEITNTSLDGFNVVIDRTDSKIKINPTSENDGAAERSGDIIINYTSGSNQSCKRSITLTQHGKGCGCGNFDVTDVIITN